MLGITQRARFSFSSCLSLPVSPSAAADLEQNSTNQRSRTLARFPHPPGEFTLLTSFQVVLLLLVTRPHLRRGAGRGGSSSPSPTSSTPGSEEGEG